MGAIYPLLPDVAEAKGDKERGYPIFHGRKVGRYVDLKLVERWYRTCCELHSAAREERGRYEQCGKEISGGLQKDFSFRLVDIRRKCISGGDLGQRYAALSCVWGFATRFVLCKKNAVELEAPGSLAERATSIPQTFLDSMKMAESLGIEHLWIDALCIVQDDKEDVQAQLANMDVVYHNAELTIVSAVADASSGLPGYPSFPRTETQIEFRVDGIELINTKRTFAETLKDSPWESRAWTLQEKVFSKRMLIFTESQAFWHCHRATWFEDTMLEPWVDRVKSLRIGDDDRYPRKYPESTLKLSYDVHMPPSRHHYQDLVRAYVPRQLSFPEDALDAFRGILKLERKVLGVDVWGLPEKCFGRSIAWLCSDERALSRRSAFPSWSWAGWGGNTDPRIYFAHNPNCRTVLEPKFHIHHEGSWKRIRSGESYLSFQRAVVLAYRAIPEVETMKIGAWSHSNMILV